MKSEGSNQGLEKAITNTKKTNNKNNVTNISRPRPVRFHPKSILITRSNNPLVSRKKSEEEEQIQQPSSAIENKAEKDDDNVKTRRPKIPDYLALILNLIWFPFDCIIKVYRGVCFVISLPGKVLDWVKYLASRPAVLAKKAVEFIRQSQTQVFQWLLNNLEGFFYLCIDYHIGALCLLAFVFWLCPLPIMTYPLFSLLRLLLGTLYPAYASYKAVRTKNVREYVKWMMYWIVFALFTSIETFTDIFVAFWFPFYYEVKILFLIWLISPVSKGSLGSSILYRRFVHPTLINREEEIDQMILKLQEQGYNTVTKLAVKAFNNVSNIVMQTAIRGGGGLVHQLRKSYSLTDLNSDEPDYGADLREITNDTDEIRELERRRRTGSTGRTNTSGQVRYVRHVSSPDSDHDTNTQMRRRQTSPRSRDSSRRDPDELSSSGYSSSAVNAEYYPVSTETMDTGDYELYDPRIHAKPRLQIQPRKTIRPEVSHYGTLPRSYSRKKTSRTGILPGQFNK